MWQIAALSCVAGTALIAAASCDSNSDTVAAPPGSVVSVVVLNDAAQPPSTATATPVVTDEGGAADARSDASDAAPPTAACDSFAPLLCNFDGVCPGYAGIGIGGAGLPSTVADGGPDGSAAFRAYVAGDAGGGRAVFGMPYQPFPTDGPLPDISGCRVTCEANVRIDQGASQLATVLAPNRDTFRFGVQDGVWVESNAADASAVGAPIADGWSHVAVVLTPTDGGGATSQITLAAADASTVTTLPISDMGLSMNFGVIAAANSGPVVVLVDDVICHVTP